MPRPKALVPALRYHISGQSICEINGTTYYLGPADSPESIARYAVLIREYQANGLKVPAHITSKTLVGLAGCFLPTPEKVDKSEEPITVDHICEAYKTHCEEYYLEDPEAIRKAKRVCADIQKHSGNKLATEFGPNALREIREDWIKTGASRNYINTLTNLTIRVFKWAVSRQHVPVDVHSRLRTIEPLRKGRTKARESTPVQACKIEHVRATAEKLSPTLKAMLRVLLNTGMRPSELCSMRPADIDRTGPEWLYVPQRHKCSNKDKDRIIPITGDARSAVEDFLNRDPNSYLFSPAESVRWQNAQKRAARKSKVQPSQLDRSKKDPKVKPGDCYTRDSFRRALARAAKEAGVPAWSPYSVRHLVGTAVAEALQLESAKALLGHSDLATTQRYSKATVRQAIEASKHAPKL